MYKKLFQIVFVACILSVTASFASAHCEVPCGIYDDEMRINMIGEHINTIEKAMSQVTALQGNAPVDYNQVTRWIMTKEAHANELQKIVTQYFMTQRIPPGDKDYMKKMSLLHKMLVAAMKCKQTTDLAYTKELSSLLKEFHHVYFGGGDE
jgi:nickel superoxide dismutase